MTARLGLETRLLGTFLRSGGGPRALLVAGCTALVSGLVLVALTVVLFASSPSSEPERVSELVADGGVRGGYVFALLLICVAPLALLRQGVRLGTATREQRLAALRIAGATPGEVRRIGAVEVGLPALVGGLLGYLVFGALRLVFGGVGGPVSGGPDSDIARQLRLVPTTVQPTWWQVLLVALAVGAVGVLAGGMASRALAISPVGVSRREPRSAPRPWAALVPLLGVALFVVRTRFGETRDDVFVLVLLAALVVGVLGLAPWIAHRVGTVAARSSSMPVLVGGRRLVTDARATARAAAAVGAIAMVAGGGGVVLKDLPDTAGGGGFGAVEAFYVVPLALTAVVLLVALVLVVFSMAVHAVESLVDRKRSIAALRALGASIGDLERAQRWEVGLVALPMAVLGVLIGSAPYLLFEAGLGGPYAWIPLLVDGVTVALVWVAVLASTRITRPWLSRAASPDNLRTA